MSDKFMKEERFKELLKMYCDGQKVAATRAVVQECNAAEVAAFTLEIIDRKGAFEGVVYIGLLGEAIDPLVLKSQKPVDTRPKIDDVVTSLDNFIRHEGYNGWFAIGIAGKDEGLEIMYNKAEPEIPLTYEGYPVKFTKTSCPIPMNE